MIHASQIGVVQTDVAHVNTKGSNYHGQMRQFLIQIYSQFQYIPCSQALPQNVGSAMLRFAAVQRSSRDGQMA